MCHGNDTQDRRDEVIQTCHEHISEHIARAGAVISLQRLSEPSMSVLSRGGGLIEEQVDEIHARLMEAVVKRREKHVSV